MKILGMGIPELLVIGAVFFFALVVVAIVLVVNRSSTSKPIPPVQYAPHNDVALRSAAAYQRLTQLDDLRKRGALTEEEFQQKKQEVMADL
ncbi:SHOCT domain-containing protein [Arabiibacter massiliensis]|uniref:SHOCT domain-containing protein n=1 Tax=Arabiibacter massiliensis TaxID=1870985 RepID=UPI0009BB91E6|nr:SHOCT domain-containing protein [Arabiibacter massiliensis]